METRANYILIGAFTLIVIAAGFLFVLWAAGRDTRSFVPYRIVFSGSVSGLSRGSVVLYNGLKIGEVRSIALSPSDPGKVIAWVAVDAATPINVDTRARLEFQGLTGVASVQMTGGNPDSRRLVVDDPDNPPLIVADRSDFQDLVENAQRLSRRADEVLAHAERIFSASEGPVTETMKNIETFSKSLADNSGAVARVLGSSATAAESIAGLSEKAGGLLDRLNRAAEKLDKVLAGAETFVGSDEVKGSLADLSDAARAVRDLARNLDARSADVANRFDDVSDKGLRQLDTIVVESRKTLAELDRTLRDFRQNPQQLLFGQRPSVPRYGSQ